MSQKQITDPETVIDDWSGVTRKIWVDEMPEDDDFVDHDDPSYHGPLTTEEKRQLEEHGKSALKVSASKYPVVLRVVYVREELIEAVEDSIQVFVAVHDDGQKKDRIYYVRGESREDAMEKSEMLNYSPIEALDNREDVRVDHLGSFAEYRENADDYEYDFRSGSKVPSELINAISPHKLDDLRERASA